MHMPPDRVEIAAALRSTHLFRSLDDTQFGLIMDSLEVGRLQTGQMLYREGDLAWHFYILVDGKIRLTQVRRRKEYALATLVAGDYFGEEAMRRRSRRPVNAAAIQDSTLVRLESHQLEKLCRQIPPLRPNLRIVASTHELVQSGRLNWLNPDEVVYLMARKHPIFAMASLIGPFVLFLLAFLVGLGLYMTILPGTITPVLVTGITYLAALGWGVWKIYDWSNDYNIVTNQRVVWMERVAGLYDSRQEAPLTTLLSVGVQTTQFGRMMGYGNVLVRTFTGTLKLRQIRYPEQVATLVEEHWTRSKELSRKDEAEIIQQTLCERLGISSTEATSPGSKTFNPLPAHVNPGFLQEWISTIFHVRFEKDGVVTYRKHWFILLKKLIQPLFWLVVACAVGIAWFTGLITLLDRPLGVFLSILAALAAAAWLVYQYVDWHNDIYQITHDQVVDVEARPFGKEERRAAPLENILTIEYQRVGILGLLLNFGTVWITIGGSKFSFEYVYNPSSVQQDVFRRMNECIMGKKQAEISADRERISDWITIYHSLQENNGLPGQASTPETSEPI